MHALPFANRAHALGILSLLLLGGCAANPNAGSGGANYRVLWTAERASDHAPLASASAPVRLGGSARVKTGERQPTEDRPAVTGFSVSLRPGVKPGVIEVTSRASVRQIFRTPTGKLARQKRTIGALLPMRPGGRELSSSAGDPIAVTVHLERAAGR